MSDANYSEPRAPIESLNTTIRRLVFTDAFTPGWIPSGKPFMTAEVTLQEVDGNKTLYTARAMHWSAEDKKAHEAMGFHDGWGQSLDRLVTLVTEGMRD